MKKNKKWLKIFVPILSVIMFIATIFVINILSLSNPTKGDAIVEYTEPRSALIVIDMKNSHKLASKMAEKK